FFFSSRRRHTRWPRDWSSDVCSSDLFWGTVVLQNFFAEDLAAIERACTLSTQSSGPVCSVVQMLQKTWRERQPIMLLLQGGCLEIGRASCRERVEVWVAAVAVK